MRILVLVTVDMVHAVRCDPTSWRVLQTAERECHKRPLEPSWHAKTSVCQEAVVSHCDCLPEEMNPYDARNGAGP